jgi:hypothetical protein
MVKNLKSWILRLSPFAIVSIVSFIVYYLTCARHLSWLHDGADGGDFATCAWTLGIAHPTGYPLYILTGYLFTHLFPIGEVAFRLNLFSALFAALGAGFIALTLREASEFLFPDLDDNLRKKWIPVVAGFSVAFSLSYWTQALIVEVYSMNAFFLSLIIYTITRIINTDTPARRDKLFILAALFSGLGFTNHLSTIYPFVAGIVTLIYLGYIPSLRCFFKALGLFILALLLYLYLPIRSHMNPIMDWGDPETWEGFVWVLTGKQFARLAFSSLVAQIIFRVYSQIDLLKQIGLLGMVTSFLGIAYLVSIRGRKRLAFFILITTTAVVNFIHIGNYLVIDPLSFMLPAFMMTALFASIGCGFILQYAIRLARNKDPQPYPEGRLALRCAKVVAVLVPFVMFGSNYFQADISGDTMGYDYAKRAFDNAIDGSIICEVYYGRGLTIDYYYNCEGWGKDRGIRPLYIEHLAYTWGKKHFRERYPDLDLTVDDSVGSKDEIAYDFIRSNYDKFPAIYFGRAFDPPEGYYWEPVDDLYRIVRGEDPAKVSNSQEEEKSPLDTITKNEQDSAY